MTPVAFSPIAALVQREPFQPHPHHLDNRALVVLLDQRTLDTIVAAHEFRGEQRGGLGIECHGRALLLDGAAVEQGDAVGDRHRLDLIVRDKRAERSSETMSARSQARASSRSFASRLESGSSSRMTGGLVNQRARERDALLLAAGELVRVARRRDAQARSAPASASTRVLISAARTRAQLEAVGDILENGAVRPQRIGLEHQAEPALLRRQLDAASRRRTATLSPMRMEPGSGVSRPATARSSVVLPLPEGPSSATTLPARHA